MSLATVQMVVFDEADRLFEMGFAEQLRTILGKLGPQRQSLLFSATLPAGGQLRGPQCLHWHTAGCATGLARWLATCAPYSVLATLLRACHAAVAWRRDAPQQMLLSNLSGWRLPLQAWQSLRGPG